MRLLILFVLTICFASRGHANGECEGNGSTGCWASSCVFSQEALFVDGFAKDGYRRAEYIIPDNGVVKYRTLMFHDADCTQVDYSSISEWFTDSDKPLTKTKKIIVDDALSLEHVTIGPFAYGNRGMVTVEGKFYLLENNLLCTSSNLLYGEDGPALDLSATPRSDGAQLRKTCLHRLRELITPPTVNIVGTVVPPYPQGFNSFEGSCFARSKNPADSCSHTIGILQTATDDTPVGIFAGTFDHREDMFIAWKVTDYIDYPNVPEGYVFTYYGCELNAVADEPVVAVLKSAEGPWLEGAIWAKKLDFATGRFVDVALHPPSVRCLLGMPEGYYAPEAAR